MLRGEGRTSLGRPCAGTRMPPKRGSAKVPQRSNPKTSKREIQMENANPKSQQIQNPNPIGHHHRYKTVPCSQAPMFTAPPLCCPPPPRNPHGSNARWRSPKPGLGKGTVRGWGEGTDHGAPLENAGRREGAVNRPAHPADTENPTGGTPTPDHRAEFGA